MKNRSIKEILFFFSVIIIMVVSLNMAVMDSTGMNLTFFRMLLLTLGTSAAASTVIIFPITLAAATVAAIGYSAFLYFTEPSLISANLQKIFEFSSWLYGYILGYNYFEPSYSMIFAIMYITFTTLVISLLVYSGRGAILLMVLGTSVLSFFWFIYVERARLYLLLFLFAAIMLYSWQIYKKRVNGWQTAGFRVERNVGRNWMLCSAVIVTLSIILSLALPLNISPVRWTWLNNKAVSIFPFIADWRNDALESSGYGFNSRYSFNSRGPRESRLGGELLQDDSVMMKVKTQGEDTIYLRGAIRDKYTGDSWSESRKSYKEYAPDSFMAIPFGISVETYERQLEITYDKLVTSTIFAPYSIHKVQYSSKRIYADADSEVYTPRMIMKNESYKVSSIIPYINVSEIRTKKAASLGANEFKVYTALERDITERVKSLARDITQAQSSNYDKVKAIEEYLRQNYKYSLKPSKLPQKAEFTDYFLFEGKEGYCTYFATSMAVLLRASGIPCRYVEGFVSRYEGSEDRVVRGTDAHAWVEVYFDDYGWVAFEATPAFPAVEFRESGTAAQETVTDTDQDTTGTAAAIPGLTRRRRGLEDEVGAAGGTANKSITKKDFKMVNIIMFILLLLLTIRVCFMYIRWILKEVRLRNGNGRSFATDYISDMIWYLRRAGFAMHQEETIREFLKRVGYNHQDRFSEIPYITEILERIRYSSEKLSDKDKKNLELFRKKVKKFTLKKAGIVQFFISLYVLGK